ncbi:MAG: FprA family A-type flavoprotein [Methanospirillum sp.]|nr:FprA family A-type flavoprotein [Methanospirillum sp.]
MSARSVAPGVLSVGAIDWDRRLFDDLIPLPDGTSYNVFLVQGSEKVALIDSVDSGTEMSLMTNLVKAGAERIDYIVVNHAEQDHTGTLPLLLEMYPEASVVTNKTCKDLLMLFHGIPEERITVVGDRETLSLGDRTLEFLITPWVHWPDTMLTYLREERVLFSCDFLGSHLATSDLFVRDTEEWRRAAKRYYAEIMMPFRNSIKGYLEKVRGLAPRMICPSHGPLHDDPELVLSAYDGWVSDEVKNEVVIAYASMHGSTRAMVEHLVDALIERGVRVRQIHVPSTELGELAMALVDPATIVIAAPTVLFGPHPAVVTAAYLTNALKPKARFATVMTSYGWGGRSVEILKGMLGQLKVEFLDPVQVKGYPTAETMESIRVLADTIRDRHKATTADYIGPA